MAYDPPKRLSSTHQARQRVIETTTERGYGKDWQRVRAETVKREPLCVDCYRRGIYRPVEEVHHVVPIKHNPDLRLEANNLAPLCRDCHERWEASGPPDWWAGHAWVRAGAF